MTEVDNVSEDSSVYLTVILVLNFVLHFSNFKKPLKFKSQKAVKFSNLKKPLKNELT
jgi:hypothetical protein